MRPTCRFPSIRSIRSIRDSKQSGGCAWASLRSRRRDTEIRLEHSPSDFRARARHLAKSRSPRWFRIVGALSSSTREFRGETKVRATRGERKRSNSTVSHDCGRANAAAAVPRTNRRRPLGARAKFSI